LEAYEEERSQEREWQASLVATLINTCKSSKLKKKVLEATDLMSKSDRVRSAKRYRAAMEAERQRLEAAGETGVVISPDWGDL